MLCGHSSECAAAVMPCQQASSALRGDANRIGEAYPWLFIVSERGVYTLLLSLGLKIFC
jgi:hypothetical protein